MTAAANVTRTWASRFKAAAATKRVESYPLVRYQDDPVRYSRERLGVRLMPHQEAILRGICEGVHGRAHPRIAVRSGQKIGKTKLVICAALWFYECFDAARVFMCAAIIQQTKDVMWHELTKTVREAREAGVDVDGKLARSPMGGFRSTDGKREIVGKSGREIEALAGLSGRMLVIIDEASALTDGKSEAFHGNLVGGGALVMISNPTRVEGPFHDAFTKSKDLYQTFHVDSERVARWQVETGQHFPGVAEVTAITQLRELYGETSPFYRVRIKGDWPVQESGRCISFATIEAAKMRWASAPESGPLAIGYDPAGDGNDGDAHAFAAVRGMKALAILRRRGLNEEAGYQAALELVAMYRRPGETPRVLIDSEGPIGWMIFKMLRAESERRLTGGLVAQFFEVVPVKSGSTQFVREKDKFVRVRDELVWNLSRWMAEGAIPDDGMLHAECYAPLWETLSNGRIQATAKKALRKQLGRSPDSFDALALAVWRASTWGAVVEEAAAAPPPVTDPYSAALERGGAMDPWSGLDAWRER